MTPAHRYDIGQAVRLHTKFGSAQTTAQAIFRVTGKLPALGNSPQYRLRCDDERHDRVATEDNLHPIEDFRQAELKREPAHGQRPETQQPRDQETQEGEGGGKPATPGRRPGQAG